MALGQGWFEVKSVSEVRKRSKIQIGEEEVRVHLKLFKLALYTDVWNRIMMAPKKERNK